MTEADEMQNDPMPEEVLEVLAHDLIVNREMRDTARRLFDRQEAGLLHAMRKADVKQLDYGRFRIRRVAVPVVACRACGAPKEVPGWLPADHHPERLEIAVNLEQSKHVA